MSAANSYSTHCPKCDALEQVLDEIEDYLEQRQDVRDGRGDGRQLANEEMSLLMDLRWWRHRHDTSSATKHD